jgi:predicted nucleotidyltransferase
MSVGHQSIGAGEMSDLYLGYIEGWRKRREEEEKGLPLRIDKRKQKAVEIALFLAKKYKVKKVILFGSLVRGGGNIHSDIDICVRGLRPKEYFKALVEIGSMVEEEVDLKPLEGCQGLLRERIEKEGEVLYEEKGRDTYLNC